jgi:CubicO group peptidase (beta-lactamase class C family)
MESSQPPIGGRSLHLVRPEEVGFSPDLDEKLEAGKRSGLLRNLHAVLVSRASQLAVEHYYEGPDERWGRSIGEIRFDKHRLHDVRSVTKSIVGVLYGIALDQGLVPRPDAPLFAQFPEYADLAVNPFSTRLTVGHALTMTLGMEWDEQRPYTDPANSEIAMENAADRCRFILGRPFVAEPGMRWIYSGGAVALVGALIERGVGQTLPEFARATLFQSLGISNFEWVGGRDGVASAASGLRLSARDLLKMGLLILAAGEWGGRRIVSREWLDASFKPAIATGNGPDYGRLWYLGKAKVPALSGAAGWIAGMGNGGQHLWLMPEVQLCVVTFAGNYNTPDAWTVPARICYEIVTPSLHRLRTE